MYILGVDTTGARMSVALTEDNRTVAEVFGDESKKHLETLMPCIEGLFKSNGIALSDIDLFAVSIGPGSFTGIRIGAAAFSALAQISERPVAQVDTLSALCHNVTAESCVCAMIDAGRNEVFARIEKNGIALMDSQPIAVSDLLEKLPVNCLLLGDGVPVYRNIISSERKDVSFADESCLLQSAASVCRCGLIMKNSGKLSTYKEISPEYLRVSQAERMKNAK